LGICRYIFCSLLSNRQLDPLQLFSNLSVNNEQFKQVIEKPVYFYHIRKKLNLTEATYAHVENLLTDLSQFLRNIRKFSTEAKFIDAAELAKHEISELIRKVKPSAVHYWVSLTIRPASPLRKLPVAPSVESAPLSVMGNTVIAKRVAQPKAPESDDEIENREKKLKIEVIQN
jgi:hypothetical protein